MPAVQNIAAAIPMQGEKLVGEAPIAPARVEILACDTVYKGFFRIDRYRLRHRLYSGSWGPELEREVFERGHAIAVLLYDPHQDALVLIEQFRIGAMAVGWTPWLLEVVAGIIEDGETAEQVARREVQEETGCNVTLLERIGHYLVSPGGCTEAVELFCGKVDSIHASGIHGCIDEGENIRVVVVPANTALDMLREGIFNNGAILIGMLWFALHRERLQQKWQE